MTVIVEDHDDDWEKVKRHLKRVIRSTCISHHQGHHEPKDFSVAILWPVALTLSSPSQGSTVMIPQYPINSTLDLPRIFCGSASIVNRFRFVNRSISNLHL
ncbi:hypothetical protein PIB30_006396 [Stylosanthes scabra]|uniref:Uncharacterized protein n=1 Tax=Stylosanthes scabra TaxID=79078 RepID=A0ABU6T4K2_9FABA|nr:hypothetical protein [Stylosanthes scabra]